MKQQTKLIAAVLLLTAAFVMVITTSFAWMTLSDSPVVQGIQVTIAGSHTVLVAPDISVKQGNQVVHYPGAFDDKLNFLEYKQYDYLQNVAGLLPVSTTDGENWYIPTYYDNDSVEVLHGDAYTGQLRPSEEFVLDNTLKYANLTPEQLKDNRDGSYVYLDFWVVAPVDGYKLRVSTGNESAGSFVVDLPDPQPYNENDEYTYELTGVNAQAAASVRIGFLINKSVVNDESVLLYTNSNDYNSSYRRLQGVYADAGIGALELSDTHFVIYEPNGNYHPGEVYDIHGNEVADGQYVLTEPIGEGGVAMDVRDRLTVQLTNSWLSAGSETLITQQFRTFMAGRSTTGETSKSLKNKFFHDWLQHQIYPYVDKGEFITNTAALYTAASRGGIVGSEEIAELNQSGATEDVFLTQLSGGVPQRIRMYIWLEGQDVDCINSVAEGSFAVSIELAGSNQS